MCSLIEAFIAPPGWKEATKPVPNSALPYIFGCIDVVAEHQLNADEIARRYIEASPSGYKNMVGTLEQIIADMIPPVNPFPWSHMKGRPAQ